MEIKNSEFVVSSPVVGNCPDDNKPEYAFIGRSNVGKSSLINMLCNHKGLAKTSATPGKTLLINHFLINKEWYLVDLPGYGYARRSKSVQQKIQQMITSYILQREQLINVFVLIDIRLEPQKIDIEFIDWLVSKASLSVSSYLEKLKETWEELPPYFVTSSEKRSGRDEILDYIDKINKNL